MCGGGGGGGSVPDWFYEAQKSQIQQGIAARDEANVGYREFSRRGREMGSTANQNAEADQTREDAYASFGNMQRMQDANMASMGVNPGDPRFIRGRDKAGVELAGKTASAMNQSRSGARREGLSLETAGFTGLAGNDPTQAIRNMNDTVRTSQQADANEAQGWGALGQGAMYGLANADKIAEGAKTIGGMFGYADGGYVDDDLPNYAQGGYVQGLQRFANGGNVYARAQQETAQMMPPPSGALPKTNAISPNDATKIAKMAVDKTATAMGLGKTAGATAESLKYANFVGDMGGDSLGALIDANAGWSGVDATGAGAATAAEGAGAGTAGAGLAAEGAGAGLAAEGAGAAAGAVAAEGAGAAAAGSLAGTLGVVGAAMPWVGGALALGSALGLFADGGQVKPKQGIGGKTSRGPVQNTKGGKVSGPGGPKDDMVLARLSPGEFVMPVGAVKKFGLDRLEKMRQAGLEFEQQGIA